MNQSVWESATIDEEIQKIVTGAQLDYRVGPAHDREGNGDLPPAWDVAVESYAVGYEPVGSTSIGNASERYKHTEFSRYRTPAERLTELNEGRHPSDGTLGARLVRLDKNRITQAYCARLDLTSFQLDETVRAILLLNLNDFGHNKRIEKVALTIIRIMVNYNRYSHLRKIDAPRISETDEFKRLARVVGINRRSMRQLSKSIKEKLSAAEFFEKDGEKSDLRQQNSNNGKTRISTSWPRVAEACLGIVMLILYLDSTIVSDKDERETLPIEKEFPIERVNEIAAKEGRAKRHYRPIYTMHAYRLGEKKTT